MAAFGIDLMIIGDGAPTHDELAAVAAIQSDEIIFHAHLISNDLTTAELLSKTFTRRPDLAKSVIRAVEGRQYLKELGGKIPVEKLPIERSFGDVTIDNENFDRYAGEVQIIQDVLPADGRVNIAAHILDEEIFLTGYLKPRQKFSFKFV